MWERQQSVTRMERHAFLLCQAFVSPRPRSRPQDHEDTDDEKLTTLLFGGAPRRSSDDDDPSYLPTEQDSLSTTTSDHTPSTASDDDDDGRGGGKLGDGHHHAQEILLAGMELSIEPVVRRKHSGADNLSTNVGPAYFLPPTTERNPAEELDNEESIIDSENNVVQQQNGDCMNDDDDILDVDPASSASSSSSSSSRREGGVFDPAMCKIDLIVHTVTRRSSASEEQQQQQQHDHNNGTYPTPPPLKTQNTPTPKKKRTNTPQTGAGGQEDDHKLNDVAVILMARIDGRSYQIDLNRIRSIRSTKESMTKKNSRVAKTTGTTEETTTTTIPCLLLEFPSCCFRIFSASTLASRYENYNGNNKNVDILFDSVRTKLERLVACDSSYHDNHGCVRRPFPCNNNTLFGDGYHRGRKRQKLQNSPHKSSIDNDSKDNKNENKNVENSLKSYSESWTALSNFVNLLETPVIRQPPEPDEEPEEEQPNQQPTSLSSKKKNMMIYDMLEIMHPQQRQQQKTSPKKRRPVIMDDRNTVGMIREIDFKAKIQSFMKELPKEVTASYIDDDIDSDSNNDIDNDDAKSVKHQSPSSRTKVMSMIDTQIQKQMDTFDTILRVNWPRRPPTASRRTRNKDSNNNNNNDEDSLEEQYNQTLAEHKKLLNTKHEASLLPFRS